MIVDRYRTAKGLKVSKEEDLKNGDGDGDGDPLSILTVYPYRIKRAYVQSMSCCFRFYLTSNATRIKGSFHTLSLSLFRF